MQVTLIRAYRPFTVSPVFKVRLDRGLSRDSGKLEGVLKLYDRRCMANFREMYDEGHPHDGQKEKEYEEYLDHLRQGFIKPVNFDDPDIYPDDLSPGGFEAYLESVCHQLFNAEKRTFLHLADLQGTKIPRLLCIVGYRVFRQDKSTYVVPGLLMEYIPSITLLTLFNSWKHENPPVPISVVPSLCNEAISLVNLLSDRSILNSDVRLENFLVRTQGGDNGHPVVIIDFACCRLRRSDEMDEQWMQAKWSQDEEGAVGFPLEKLVKTKLGVNVWKYRRSLRFMPDPQD
jgi:serine/threonine protein kinase